MVRHADEAGREWFGEAESLYQESCKLEASLIVTFGGPNRLSGIALVVKWGFRASCASVHCWSLASVQVPDGVSDPLSSIW